MTSYYSYRFPSLQGLNEEQRDEEAEHTRVQVMQVEEERDQTHYQAGYDAGYPVGYDAGHASGFAEGLTQGHTAGLQEGAEHAYAEKEALLEKMAAPINAMRSSLKAMQEDYQAALRKEMVELVAKVARQVIRCELTLQPAQLLALVDETLATMPPVQGDVFVHLNPEECQRVQELAPDYAERWNLISDSRLEPGECTVKTDAHEADAGCHQRLEACIDQVREQFLHS